MGDQWQKKKWAVEAASPTAKNLYTPSHNFQSHALLVSWEKAVGDDSLCAHTHGSPQVRQGDKRLRLWAQRENRLTGIAVTG